jgi:TRAP-type C4-dicarboxylate transport system permease small subunit
MARAIQGRWSNAVKWFDRTIAYANLGVLALGSLALGILPLIVFYDVFARYVFNAPSIWVVEISTYLLQLMVFLPMGVLVTENAHVRSTLLTDRLPASVRRGLRHVSQAIGAVYASFILWFGWNFVVHSWKQDQVSATLIAVPLWIPGALIPLGGLLLLISSLGALASPHIRGGGSN